MNFVPDVLVLGSGLSAACCAHEFARRGHRVEVYGEDLFGAAPQLRWATVTDHSEEMLRVSALGLAGLHELRRSVGESFLWATGTLSVAIDSLEWAKLQLRAERFKDAGVACETVGGGVLTAIEPCLSNALPGGVYLPDGLSFEPMELTARLLQAVERASFGPRFRVRSVQGNSATFVSGEVVEGGIVIRTGRHGHGCGPLQETSGTVFVGRDRLSLPVSTGTAVFGPTAVGWEGVSERPVQTYQEIRRAFPSFERDNIAPIHWCRAADGLPLIGESEESQGVYVATGLEGHDLAVAMGAAMLLSAQVESRPLPIEAAPFSPARVSQHHGAAG